MLWGRATIERGKTGKATIELRTEEVLITLFILVKSESTGSLAKTSPRYLNIYLGPSTQRSNVVHRVEAQ